MHSLGIRHPADRLSEARRTVAPASSVAAKERRRAEAVNMANERRICDDFFFAGGAIRARIDQNSLVNEPYLRQICWPF
jgi:hypothetical protein